MATTGRPTGGGGDRTSTVRPAGPGGGGGPARPAAGQPVAVRPVAVRPAATTVAATPPVPVSRTPARDSAGERPPYLKFAFANPYNLSLLAGGLAAAGLTFSPVLALAVLGLEGIWLVNAPGSTFLQRFIWDPQFERARAAERVAARQARIAAMDEADRKRIEDLVVRQAEIQRLAAQNPSFTGDLLRGELTKTDRLVDAFIDLAVTSSRYDQYLSSVDVRELDAERGRLERDVRAGKDGDQQTDLARKNLAIILKRLDKMKEIQRYMDLARGELDLIENSFQLIADQIVTMQSPQELSGQLNDLLDGVESIRQTAQETDAILNTLGNP